MNLKFEHFAHFNFISDTIFSVQKSTAFEKIIKFHYLIVDEKLGFWK